jgi:aspartate/glutamate racemase
MTDDRLRSVLERCRQQLHPELSHDLLVEAADIQTRYQFNGPDDRKDPQKDLQRLVDEEMQRLGHGGASR